MTFGIFLKNNQLKTMDTWNAQDVSKCVEDLPEVSNLVGELVVEQGASMLVSTTAQVADVWPLVRFHVIRRCRCWRWCLGLHG